MLRRKEGDFSTLVSFCHCARKHDSLNLISTQRSCSFGPNKPRDERKFAMCDLSLQVGSRLTYEYDFGDNWQHDLLVEKIQPAEKGTQYPICMEGAGDCPPEDVGGV